MKFSDKLRIVAKRKVVRHVYKETIVFNTHKPRRFSLSLVGNNGSYLDKLSIKRSIIILVGKRIERDSKRSKR